MVGRHGPTIQVAALKNWGRKTYTSPGSLQGGRLISSMEGWPSPAATDKSGAAVRGSAVFFIGLERMRYGKRPDPTPEEIEAIIKAIQAGWSDEDRKRHARGFVGDDRELFDSWEVPTVSISLPDFDRA